MLNPTHTHNLCSHTHKRILSFILLTAITFCDALPHGLFTNVANKHSKAGRTWQFNFFSLGLSDGSDFLPHPYFKLLVA